jgi:hypothetical protein
MDWVELKDVVAASTGLHRDALHVYAAVLIQLAVAALARRSLAALLPWLVVLLFQLANELLDFWAEGGPILAWRVEEAARDSVNTMALPTLLLIVARLAPSLLVRAGGRRPRLRRRAS